MGEVVVGLVGISVGIAACQWWRQWGGSLMSCQAVVMGCWLLCHRCVSGGSIVGVVSGEAVVVIVLVMGGHSITVLVVGLVAIVAPLKYWWCW